MIWTLVRTDTFLESLRTLRQNKEFLAELQKRLIRLQEDPLHTGGWLSGSLKGKKSTRIFGKYRLIFTPIELEHIVYLNLIDHRSQVYT
jgi:mRNA-degrading endonuclease RelE of RelBE toxin-antitoxin system